MALVGDEDALLELTKRAVNEALYQPRRVRVESGYQPAAHDLPARPAWPPDMTSPGRDILPTGRAIWPRLRTRRKGW